LSENVPKILKRREIEIEMYSLVSQMVVVVDFLCYVWLFVILKILIQMCKIISCISTLFGNIQNWIRRMVKHITKSQQWQQLKYRVSNIHFTLAIGIEWKYTKTL
jgi:hypothetical protein